MCSIVKHTFTSGENAKMEPNNSQVHSTLGVALVQEFRMFRALVEKANKHQIKPLGYHWKGLEM